MSRTATDAVIHSEFIDHGDYRTFVSRAGSGPPVLLLHGSGPGVSGLANWTTTLTSELAASFELIAPDIVGFGATEFAAGLTLDQAARVAHISSLLDALELRGINVVGNSMGGGVALHVAARHPGLIGRMVLMGSAGVSFPITPVIDEFYGYEPSLELMQRMFDSMLYDPSIVPAELVQARYEATAQPGANDRYREMFAPPRQRHIDDQALSDDELRRIDVPTLLVHGAHDKIVPLEMTSVHLVRVLPDADLLVFGRCGHWTQAERGVAFRRALAEFFGVSSP